MSRRKRCAREQAVRSRVARAKALRRRARSLKASRSLTAAIAATVALAGLAASSASATAGSSPALKHVAGSGAPLAKCSDPQTLPSNPSYLTPMAGTLFFTANDGVHGQELWKSNGSAGGTVLVKDITPGAGGGYYSYGPSNLTPVGKTLFFVADDGTHGRELWKSDGTKAGTVLVKDIDPGSGGYYDYGPSDLLDVGGTLFFVADDGTHGRELWKSDGTASGTVMVKDILSGAGGGYRSAPSSLTDVDGTLFFAAQDRNHGKELWKSDGTKAGTVMVKNIRPSDYDSSPSDLTEVGGTLFFSAIDGIHGRELWKSDGTKGGTVLVKNITPGGSGGGGYQYGYYGGPEHLTDVGGRLFFSDDDGVHGTEVWTSDGTKAGTVMVKDITTGDTGYYDGPDNLTAVGGTLFFADDDGTRGQELWKSDGTPAGTVLVRNINPGAYGGYPDSLTDVQGQLFFTARDGVHGPELWKSDGTKAGTVMVKDIHPCARHGAPYGLAEYKGMAFFAADDGVHGYELWKSDGSSAGTAMVKDINQQAFTKAGAQAAADARAKRAAEAAKAR